jgi:voltage-gated potassium channel
MFRDFKGILFIVLLLFIVGTIGYTLIEGWGIFDSLYMTIITLSTTGYREIKPLSDLGRVFTMILIILGVSILFYMLGNLNIVLFERNFFRNKKMQTRINHLQNHYIICGFGRMGKKIASELDRRKKPFVIIEKAEPMSDTAGDFAFIQGDATEDSNLINAGIQRARGLVAVLGDDASNVFTTLSSRVLNPALKIIAKAEEESSREKMIKAGADRVVLPYEIGGFRVTQALLKPTVVDYIDEVFSRSDIGLEIEEVKLSASSALNGKTVRESGLRSDLNIIIIGISKESGEWIYNPRSETKLESNDILIVIGGTNELITFEKMANP